MGRRSAAKSIEPGDLRRALATIIRATHVLERYERVEVERRARARLPANDDLRTRLPLTTNVCSDELGKELRRRFAKVIKVADAIDGAMPLGRDARHLVTTTDVKHARASVALEDAFNALPRPRKKQAIVGAVVALLKALKESRAPERVGKVVDAIWTPDVLKRAVVGRETVLNTLDGLGISRARIERLERVRRRATENDPLGPLNAAEFEALAFGTAVSTEGLLEYCEHALRGRTATGTRPKVVRSL